MAKRKNQITNEIGFGWTMLNRRAEVEFKTKNCADKVNY